MSPSEFDLRAALRDGEGDGIDVGAVIAGAEAQRRHRRVRIQSGAAVAAIVAVVGFGGFLISRSGGGSGGASSADAGATAARAGGTRPTPASPPGSRAVDGLPAARSAAAACPRSFPRYALPGGGSAGQFGSGGALYDKPVHTVLVCSYGASVKAAGAAASTPAAERLTGPAARELVSSLENAAKVQRRANCPLLENSVQTDLAMIGYTAGGSKIATVTATLTVPPCNVEVTNGTAVRYDWQPPTDLQASLLRTPAPSGGGVASLLPGRVHGSPINS